MVKQIRVIVETSTMKRFVMLVLLIGLAALAVGCGRASTTAIPTEAVYAPAIDPANFVTTIDNPYFPLQPGTTFVYEGRTEKGNEHNAVYVTYETRVILGVTCVVVSDTVPTRTS